MVVFQEMVMVMVVFKWMAMVMMVVKGIVMTVAFKGGILQDYAMGGGDRGWYLRGNLQSLSIQYSKRNFNSLFGMFVRKKVEHLKCYAF